jgi:hypothetical protein
MSAAHALGKYEYDVCHVCVKSPRVWFASGNSRSCCHFLSPRGFVFEGMAPFDSSKRVRVVVGNDLRAIPRSFSLPLAWCDSVRPSKLRASRWALTVGGWRSSLPGVLASSVSNVSEGYLAQCGHGAW